MRRLTLLLWFILPFFMSKAYAVPVYPHPIDVTQPDGSVLTIQMHGDEHFNYVTTSDGYLLKYNSAGSYEYARFINDEIVSSGVLARNNRTEEEHALLITMSNSNPVPRERLNVIRSKSPFKSPVQRGPALFGNKKILVILVNFADKSFNNPSTAKARFSSMLNDNGYSANGATGSVRDYFIASSNGNFQPTFDVFGPYTLSNNMTYYSNDTRAMIVEAAQKACGDINTADYDYNNDGVVDNVFVYYAGYSNAEASGHNYIHPHHSYVNSNYECGGKRFSEYACGAELRGYSGTNMTGIGTFCHEFGHTLGLPDLYDVNVGNNYTVGDWDVMCSGCYNNNSNTPPTYSAHERFLMGYMTAPDIKVLSTRGRYELEPIATTNTAYLISSDDVSFGHNLSGTSPNPSEYFLLENRQRVGWDSVGLPATGMLVARVQYSGGRWGNNTVNIDQNNLLYDIIEADGSGSATPSSYQGDPFPGSTNRTDWEPTLKNGTQLDAALTLIENDNGIIKFAFRGGNENDPYIDILGFNKLLKTVAGTPSDSLIFDITGGNLTQDVVLSFSESRFEMKLDGTNTWTNTLTLQPDQNDSTLASVVYVRYNPTAPSYNNIHSTLFKAQGEVSKSIKVEGKSTRQIYITVPEALPATNVSPYSFQANWTEVYDPTYVAYYLSVYTKDGETNEKEEFANFNNTIPFGWQSTFKTVTTITPASAPCAVVFKTEADTLYSTYYITPVEKIKFWVRSEDAAQEGLFEIYGYNENGWNIISTIPVNKSLTAQVKEISLNVEDNYHRFKFACNGISSKGMAFDDFTASYKASFIVEKQMVNEADSFRIAPLEPNKNYYYKVQATDKDPRDRYENITDFSNEMLVKLPNGQPLDSRNLTVNIDDAGNLILSIYDADIKDSKGNPLDLYVFSLTGQLVQKIPYNSFVNNSEQVVISGLAPNNTYIISLGAKRKSKFAKVFVK